MAATKKPGNPWNQFPKKKTSAPKPQPKVPAGTPHQVSDPWAKPKRASIGNVKGPASNPNRPAAAPKSPAKPSGNFKAPTVPKPPKRYPSSPLSSQPNGAKMGRIGASGALRGGAEAALLAAGQAGVDRIAPPMGRALGTALRPVGRRIDDLLPGVNSKDEARRIKAKTPLRGVTPAESARVVRLPQATGDAPAKPKPPTAPVLPRATTRTTSSSPAPRPAVRTTAPKPSPASTPKPVDKVPSTAVTKAEPAAPQRAMSNADDYKKYQEAASNFLNSKTASKEGRMAAAELKKRRLAIGK